MTADEQRQRWIQTLTGAVEIDRTFQLIIRHNLIINILYQNFHKNSFTKISFPKINGALCHDRFSVLINEAQLFHNKSYLMAAKKGEGLVDAVILYAGRGGQIDQRKDSNM